MPTVVHFLAVSDDLWFHVFQVQVAVSAIKKSKEFLSLGRLNDAFLSSKQAIISSGIKPEMTPALVEF